MPKLNLTNTLKLQNIPGTTSYSSLRTKEAEEIKELLNKGLIPIRYNDYYMELGGKTFNGWSKDDVERLR
jgi:hypothetical protein